MRYHEFITERNKKRKKTKLARYFFPGFAYYGSGTDNASADAGGDGGGGGGGESKPPKALFNPRPMKNRPVREEGDDTSELQSEVAKFAEWAGKQLKLKNMPKIKLSMDTEEAQTGHHTGKHTPGDNYVWVYARNRNLVDILRTVFHELVHVRQHEKNMINPGDSYPGSPIEAQADMLAGKFIKIYGKFNHNIFQ